MYLSTALVFRHTWWRVNQEMFQLHSKLSARLPPSVHSPNWILVELVRASTQRLLRRAWIFKTASESQSGVSAIIIPGGQAHRPRCLIVAWMLSRHILLCCNWLRLILNHRRLPSWIELVPNLGDLRNIFSCTYSLFICIDRHTNVYIGREQGRFNLARFKPCV